MLNFNDAEITRVYVSQEASATVQDDTPNAPAGGPYDVTIEMVVSTGRSARGSYTLYTWSLRRPHGRDGRSRA